MSDSGSMLGCDPAKSRSQSNRLCPVRGNTAEVTTVELGERKSPRNQKNHQDCAFFGRRHEKTEDSEEDRSNDLFRTVLMLR